MKKIFTLLAMASLAMTGSAQTAQQYFRVEFDMPIVSDGSGKTAVAAGMKDDYTYCNPEHQYLDFQANGTLTATGKANPMGFRTTTSNVTETSSFYLENGRLAQGGVPAKMPYQVDHITKITAYSLPVKKVSLVDSVPFTDYKFVGNNKTYRGTIFTFDRLPRNVAELKTLLEDANGQRVEACNNPLFIAAVMYLVWPRLLDCSQDCRDMVDYLYGTQYSALNTYGISNQAFQQACIAQFTSNGGKDAGGFWLHNNVFQYFAGATPGNQYKPNGKGYGYDNGPYKVRVVWDPQTPILHSGDINADVAKLLLMPNPDGVTKGDISFEDPTAHSVLIRPTKKNGWFFWGECKIYYGTGKQQRDDEF